MKSILFLFVLTLLGFTGFAQDQPASANPSGEVFSMAGLDVQPQFPGNFQNEVMKNFRVDDIEQDIDAKLYMSFVIEPDGTLSNIKCERNPGFGLCASAEMALKAIKTKWNPGINDGAPVRVKYHLPIVIKIKSDPTPVKKD